MKNIIIDCDPGHDDAIAILAATHASEVLNVCAIGTVGGNHHLDKITQNARLILQTLNARIPLYAGCSQPIAQELLVQPDAHGESGMDGLSVIPKLTYPVEAVHAVEAYKMILEKKQDVTIVALGPLTNLAMLIKLYPSTAANIKEISIMGGGLDRGNVTPYAEFNIYADPEAARIVFESGIPIIMSGLDVTEKAYLTYDDIQTLRTEGTVSHFAYELLMFYYQSGKQFGFNVAAMHDATAVCVLTHPELFMFESHCIEISCDGITRGMTCADKRVMRHKENNVRVAMDVNQPAFAEVILGSIRGHDFK